MTGGMDIILSVVVPAFNEEGNIARLHGEIRNMCEVLGCDYEIIVVNDGSTDRTGSVCRELHPLKYVELDRNFGQTAALDCGFKEALGRYVAALDGDGQNDPADIPAMIRYMEDNGLDVVCGWRNHRQDNFDKRILSRLAYMLRQVMLKDGIHDSGCTLKVFRREALEGLELTGGQHRFIPAIMLKRGYNVGEMVVSHRPRLSGKSNYHATVRIFQGIRDMISLRYSSHRTRACVYSIKEVVDL